MNDTIIALAREGKKEEFKAAIKEQLNQRRDTTLTNLRTAMAASIGQKKK